MIEHIVICHLITVRAASPMIHIRQYTPCLKKNLYSADCSGDPGFAPGVTDKMPRDKIPLWLFTARSCLCLIVQ